MPATATHRITVEVRFPGGDIHARPVVITPSSSVAVIHASDGAIEWSLSTLEPPDANDELEIIGVSFFADAEKAQPISPTYLELPGAQDGRMNWVIAFNGQAVPSEQTLTYTLHLRDADHPWVEWDPTIKVQPRGA